TCLFHPCGPVEDPRAAVGRITGRCLPFLCFAFLLRRPGHGTLLVLVGVLRVRVGAGIPMYDRARAVLAPPSHLLQELRGLPCAPGATAPPVAAGQQGGGSPGYGDAGPSPFLKKVALCRGLLEVGDSL